MKKITLLIILNLLLLSMASCFTSSDESTPNTIVPSESNIYIDPSALTDGDGSISSPYKYWSSVNFQAGYSYLQKRNTIAREQITVNNPGTPVNYSSITSYNSTFSFAQNNIGADPELNANLTLQSNTSPCYMTGSSSAAIAFDYTGNNFRNPPSIGAYEYY